MQYSFEIPHRPQTLTFAANTVDLEKLFYIGIAVAQLGLIVWYFYRNSRKSAEVKKKKDALAREYPFEGLRNMALTAMPGAIFANVPEGETYLYSVVMDWNMGDDIITLATNITGEANLYVKSGGGIVGAGKHQPVSEAAQTLVAFSRKFLNMATQPSSTPLPEKNIVQFILLTNNGKYLLRDEMKNIESRNSPFHELYEQSSYVINEMRKTVANAQNTITQGPTAEK